MAEATACFCAEASARIPYLVPLPLHEVQLPEWPQPLQVACAPNPTLTVPLPLQAGHLPEPLQPEQLAIHLTSFKVSMEVEGRTRAEGIPSPAVARAYLTTTPCPSSGGSEHRTRISCPCKDSALPLSYTP